MQYPIIETVGLTLSLAWRHKFRALGYGIIFGILSASALITISLGGGFLASSAGSPGLAAGLGFAVAVLNILVSHLLLTGSIMATSGSMAEDALGEEIGFGAALSLALKRMFNGFFSALIVGIPVFIAAGALAVYASGAMLDLAVGDMSALAGIAAGAFGIFVLLTWIAVSIWPLFCVSMLEGEGVSYNIARSLELTRGHRWRIFGGNILVGLIVMGLMIIGQIILYMMVGGSIIAMVMANPGLGSAAYPAITPSIPTASWGMMLCGGLVYMLIMYMGSLIALAQQGAIYAQLVRIEER